jgi:hypothetical protein
LSLADAVTVCQSVGGAYFLAAAQSLFANRMLQTLKTASPNIDAILVINTGASEIRDRFEGEDLEAVTNAYMIGIKAVFIFAIAGSALAVLLALLIPFRKLPAHEDRTAGTTESPASHLHD